MPDQLSGKRNSYFVTIPNSIQAKYCHLADN